MTLPSVKSQGIKFPGQVHLNQVKIESYSGFVIDVRPQVSDISISEDLFDNFVQCTVTLTDSLNLIKNIPLIGNEVVTISFNTPSLKEVTYRFGIYRISPRVAPAGPSTSIYTLHLVSLEYFASLSVQFSKSFVKMKHSEMAEAIYENYMINANVPRPFFAEPTEGIHNFTFTYTHPAKAINLLAKKSVYDKDSISCNYIFYENQKGFFFLPLNYWSVGEYKDYSAAVYRYFPPNVALSGKGIDEDLSRMEGYDIGPSAQTARNIAEGVYSSTALSYDITTKTLFKKLYSYNFDFYRTPHTSKYGVIPDINEKFSENYTAVKFLSPTSSERYGYKNSDDDTNILNMSGRVSQIMGANQLSITFIAPGDSRRKIGEPITIKIQSKEPQIIEDDPYLSGRYIISKVMHNIQGDTYKIMITAIKDTMDVPYPNKKNK